MKFSEFGAFPAPYVSKITPFKFGMFKMLFTTISEIPGNIFMKTTSSTLLSHY